MCCNLDLLFFFLHYVCGLLCPPRLWYWCGMYHDPKLVMYGHICSLKTFFESLLQDFISSVNLVTFHLATGPVIAPNVVSSLHQ